jgi:RNA exonuclease 4
VIGHDIQKDLKVTLMDLPYHILRLQRATLWPTPTTVAFDMTVCDTQKCSVYRQFANRGAHQGPSLKNLALKVLGCPIKQGQVSSVEDAIATNEVYRNAKADSE